MTLKEINDKRKKGDIKRVSELSGLSHRTIEDVLYGKVSYNSKRATEVIKWFTSFIECRESVKGE